MSDRRPDIALDGDPTDGRITAMASEKVSITLDPAIVAEARRMAGDGGLSAFVNDVLRWHLQHLRLRKYLAELDEEFGPVPEELREEAKREWDAIESSWTAER
jgi:Arc/MetJ family transcription regulator